MHDKKESVDQDFNEAVHFGIDHITHVAMCIGSHNIKSCELALVKATEEAVNLNHPHIVFSQLYGMSDPLSNNLAHYGANVSKYMPYGSMKVSPTLSDTTSRGKPISAGANVSGAPTNPRRNPSTEKRLIFFSFSMDFFIFLVKNHTMKI